MIKIPENKIRQKYGIEYYNLLLHKIRMWNNYKINIPINNQLYGLQTYNTSH